MPDVFTKEKRSIVMAAIRSRRNKDTELRLISIFRKFGVRGWRREQNLPGKPDFVFRSCHLAVFVDGCFWHGCPKHGRIPTSNVEYWGIKLKRNRSRDRKIQRLLRRKGWRVIRLWEHELAIPERAVTKILKALA
jgi:DNA mismatch endonuclease (patch repair protein)